MGVVPKCLSGLCVRSDFSIAGCLALVIGSAVAIVSAVGVFALLECEPLPAWVLITGPDVVLGVSGVCTDDVVSSAAVAWQGLCQCVSSRLRRHWSSSAKSWW